MDIIREANIDDLDSIAKIGIATIATDKIRSYRYRYAREFPEEHEFFVRRRYADWLDDTAKPNSAFKILVLEAPCPTAERKMEIRGFTIWQMPGSHMNAQGEAANHRKPQVHHRPDIDFERKKIYKRIVKEGRERLFYPRYGEMQIGLVQLFIDPEHKRKGYGRRLMGYCADEALKRGASITLLTHDESSAFYDRLGFKTIGTIVLPLEDNLEGIVCQAKVYEDSIHKKE